MSINLKRMGVRLGRMLAVAGLVALAGPGVASAQTAPPLMSSAPPVSEMGTAVAPHDKTIYELVPAMGTEITDNYTFLKPVTPSRAGFLYKVIGYNFNTLADVRYESSVVNTSFKTKIQDKMLVTLTANEYTVPMPPRVSVKNDALHSTTYYERDDSVVVVKVTKGNVSITADTRQGLWTSAGMTTDFVNELLGGNKQMAHVQGDKTSSWWQDAAKQGKTLVFSRPVFSGVGENQEADMFIGTSEKNGRNYHFVQEDGEWKLAGSGHDAIFWHKK
jgi:hypothetical protein